MSPTAASLSAPARIILGTLIVSLALLMLAGGWMIPFKFESFSILYKFGIEKVYLRSGKMVGITIAQLLFFQVLLASRFAILERIFTLKAVFNLHRFNGMIIMFLVVLHPLLIKASENFTPYTFEKKYYPEFLGISLLGVILVLSVTAVFRSFLKMPYPGWLLLHRLGATLALVIMPAHVLWVSETFKSGLPRTAALVIFFLALFLAARVWLQRFSGKMK
jgi:predicted ferric reductase